MPTTARTTRKAAMTKKSAKASSRKRVAALTPSAAQLIRYANKHPVPAAFWTGEDDPSKPAKR